jgi:protease I
MSKNALIITGKLVQDHEYIYPYYRIQEEGFTIDVATDKKIEVPGSIGIRVIPTLDIAGISPDKFDLLILPGGAKCMEYLRQDPRVIQFISDFNAKNKTIASICHAAQLLISAKVVKGRNISGYYSLKDDIVNAGANYVDEPCVIDANIVSTAHYKDLHSWMKGVIDTYNKINP